MQNIGKLPPIGAAIPRQATSNYQHEDGLQVQRPPTLFFAHTRQPLHELEEKHPHGHDHCTLVWPGGMGVDGWVCWGGWMEAGKGPSFAKDIGLGVKQDGFLQGPPG